MNRYGDVKYTQEDIERIIANKERRLEDIEQCWDGFTRHMECGEIRELKESCIDDEIIIACLKEAKYYNHLIETFNKLNEDLKVAAESLAENNPVCKKLTGGNYVLQFDSDVWDFGTVHAYFKHMCNMHPDCFFSLLPFDMELIEIEETNQI